MRDWIELAISPAIRRRALRIAAFVGPVLIVINHGDALLRLDVDAGRLLKMALTFLVPYLVSTHSSVQSARAAADQSG